MGEKRADTRGLQRFPDLRSTPRLAAVELAEDDADHLSFLRYYSRIRHAGLDVGRAGQDPLGAHLLVEGARAIARDVGISEAVIGLAVVAIGTSLPELATTVMAALRRHADVAIGNVIGSNIFNITVVIGAAALAAPLAVPEEIASRDLWVMIGASLLLTPFVLGCRRIGRPAGGAFLLLYGIYIYYALAG